MIKKLNKLTFLLIIPIFIAKRLYFDYNITLSSIVYISLICIYLIAAHFKIKKENELQLNILIVLFSASFFTFMLSSIPFNQNLLLIFLLYSIITINFPNPVINIVAALLVLLYIIIQHEFIYIFLVTSEIAAIYYYKNLSNNAYKNMDSYAYSFYYKMLFLIFSAFSIYDIIINKILNIKSLLFNFIYIFKSLDIIEYFYLIFFIALPMFWFILIKDTKAAFKTKNNEYKKLNKESLSIFYKGLFIYSILMEFLLLSNHSMFTYCLYLYILFQLILIIFLCVSEERILLNAIERISKKIKINLFTIFIFIFVIIFFQIFSVGRGF